MAKDVFISYSRKNKGIASQVCNAFDKAGISYFIDCDEILSGQDFVNVIIKAIRDSSIFLFMASQNSYASQITIDEVYEALDGVAKGNHQIITYIIDGSELPDDLRFRLRRYNWRIKDEHPIESVLVTDIKKLLSKDNSIMKSADSFDIETNATETDRKRQDESEKLVLYMIKRDGKYGFKEKNGKIVIPCIWKDISSFREGLARVMDLNGKWGFVDKAGKIVIPCQWIRAESFSEGLACVVDDNNRYGFIDKTGKIVIPCQWEGAYSFYHGFAEISDDLLNWKKIDKTGKIVTKEDLETQ